MKAPEKIYVHIRQKPCEITFSEVKEEGVSNIEYTRTDAFIEKAADKFKQLMYDQHFFEGMVYQDAIIENLVGYFKTYMKEE